MKKIIALVPMKGNSERVKNKNLRLFNGQPLYHVVVKELLKSKLISEIVINTDSENIKKDVNANFPSVKIVDRPVEIQGDFVPMNDIIGYDMSQTDGDVYIQTHSTSPLLKIATVDKALETFLASEACDSVFSVTRFQTRFYWEDGRPVNHNPKELLRTQDLPPVFEDNSNFYIFTKQSFKEADGKRIGIKPLMYPIDKLEAVDIDEPQDFIIAEGLYKILTENA
ncbi:acylneuraminate cytidylyltransferase family protein [Hufsiella ginkgonis]|uniref:Acylneuraminate cytidylyltransferase family protein n=1 Tax=Hufsiella ginkgonis TaxID=2695274 RepID=A0A7K1Y2I2_9SPHI|nr:acylneuraminate cytidylyltransferase family protein [Hufsiella ginkgonis]MXV17422.1 acylneuraminate cytidylyltransferase family protein [Hufsiella ginkgonis]